MKKSRSIIFTGFLSIALLMTSCGGNEVKKYTITFLDDDQTELSVIKVKKGEMPVYDKEEPTKARTAQYTYTFSGWSPELVEATADATYTATYASTVNKYTVKFMNGDNELQSEQLDYGTMPVYKGEEPAKDSTESKVYTFNGWDKEVVTVTEDVTYSATFKEDARKYTIKFMNGETELQSEEVAYGVVPTYKGELPTKQGEGEAVYNFECWDKEVVTVTGDATYTALFHEPGEHALCVNCGKLVGGKVIGNSALLDTQIIEDETVTPAPGFEKVYGRLGFANGKIGADIDISKYTNLYFALSHSMHYGYVFGGSDEYAKLWAEDWYQIILERDDSFNWQAFYKKFSDEEWTVSKIDGTDQKLTNLADLLKMYNWDKEGETAQLKCSEVYGADRHQHTPDDYGICTFCGDLIDKVKASDYAVKGSQLTNEVAPIGFESVYSVSGLANGNVGADFDTTGYKKLYFCLYHDISYVYLFGGNNSQNPTLWKEDWYKILMVKESTGWVAYFKKAYEQSWTTNRSKVDGANDANFSSILRMYNWSDLASANVKCTEVYGVLA